MYKNTYNYNLPISIVIYLLVSLLEHTFTQAQTLTPPKREFRAVWIATVNNIDWPSNSWSTTEEQKEQFIKLLDHHKKNGINAVIVQIRPAADAFYKSKYEPWSQWLNGKQGEPPNPSYDPLEFMIEAAHERMMEFHAWVNPFRAVTNIHSANIHPMHITKRKPEWFLTYGSMRMFNPGIPEVRGYLLKVLGDIIIRYDIDGIHFDDYFYPYPDPQYKLGDHGTFLKYRKGFKFKHQWRRDNVNLFISSVHRLIQNVKPYVKFGVSPYGVWRNSNMSAYGSKTTSGYTSYDHLHADVRLWLENGWVDYVMPQLYQNTRHKKSPYKVLVDWWARNTFGKHLYIGHATFRLFVKNDRSWASNTEMPNQVRYSRGFKTVHGNVYYSSNSLIKNQGHFQDTLRKSLYKVPALIPAMPWKDNTPPKAPQKPTIDLTPKGVMLTWQNPGIAEDEEEPYYYILYRQKDTLPDIKDPRNILAILPKGMYIYYDEEAFEIDDYKYLLTSVDRLHNESEAVEPLTFVPEPPPPVVKLPYSDESIAFFSELMVNNCRRHLGLVESD